MPPAPDEQSVEAVRAAAERLCERLRFRDAEAGDGAAATTIVPRWWRVGMADCHIFGDGLLSWPGSDEGHFSRAVTLFDGREISVSAGGDYLPFAWIDGGVDVAIVAIRGAVTSGSGPGPVYVGPPDGARPAQLMAESLVAFLDGLRPQTLCLLAGSAGRRRIEICGERMLLIERAGQVRTQTFASDDEVGRFVGKFLSDSIDDGLRVVSCPARMRPLVAGYSGEVAQARTVAPEVRAERVIQSLLADDLLDLVEDVEVEVEQFVEQFVDQVARYLDSEAPRFGPSGRPSDKFARRFIDWLIGHAAVDDLYADDEQVAAAFELE